MALDELKQSILQTYRQNGQKIACAESCTGGMVAAALTDFRVFGNFWCACITWPMQQKDMLGILEKTLGDFGAVSEEIAREMAIGALERSGATSQLP